jgi:hypothetical protein
MPWFRRLAVAPPIPAQVRVYLDALLVVWHEQQRAELFTRLNRFIFTSYINSLSPHDRATLEQMEASGRTLIEVEEFIHDHVPNMPSVYQTALTEFRALYLGEVARRDSAHDD